MLDRKKNTIVAGILMLTSVGVVIYAATRLSKNTVVSNYTVESSSPLGMSATFSQVEDTAKITLKNRGDSIGFAHAVGNAAGTKEGKQVVYKDPVDSTQFRYSITEKGVKEEIVLSSVDKVKNNYTYQFELGDLVPKRAPDGLWYFYRSTDTYFTKPVFYIPRPFMVDAAGQSSEDLELVKTVAEGKVFFDLVFLSDWLQDASRVYPVTIDPSIEIPADYLQSEVLEQRTAQTKTYDLGNYQYSTTSYLEPIHYKDDKGVWQLIDTSIEDGSGEYGYAYQNTSNTFKTFFKEASDDYLAEYKMGGSWLRIKPLSNSEMGEIQSSNAVVYSNSITYPDIFSDVDLKFTVDSLFLEEFIVKDAQKAVAIEQVAEEISLQNADFESMDDGTIRFFDPTTGENLWVFPKPVMYEHADLGNSNYDLHYSIECLDGSSASQGLCDVFTLTKVIEQKGREWLQSSERNYPVVIDATAGPYAPSSLVDDSAVGTLAWTNPGNAAALDGAYATATNDTGNNLAYTHYIKASGFGFGMPPAAAINGVQVAVRRKASHNTVTAFVLDNVCSLVKGGVVSGTNKYDSATKWPVSDGTVTYGSTSDLWGLSLAGSDVSASNFGFVIQAAVKSSLANTVTAYVDQIAMTVTYTSPPAIHFSGVNLSGVNIY